VPAEVVIPPSQQTAISAPVGGLVSRLFVAEGETVTAGQAVAEISSPDFMRLQREFLESLAADELARNQLERDRSLFAEGIIATRRVQEAEAAARAAGLARSQSRQQLAIAGLDASAVDRLIAARELASVLVLRAPFAGVVIEQNAAVGDSLDAFDPVVRIADLSQLWIEAHVPQEIADRIRPGMRMTAMPGNRRLEADVTTIGRTVNPDTQTVLVRGAADNGPALSAGQFMTVTIVSTDESMPTFAVPATAVTRSADATQIFVRSSDGFRMAAVDVITENGETAFVRGDVATNDQIAIDGVSALKSLLAAQQEEE
jgi:RND family efflux transporter MFP subunit